MSTDTQPPASSQAQTPATRPPVREIRVVEDNGVLANLFDTARFEHSFRIAEAMASASLIPEHLWKDKSGVFEPSQVRGNCFLIVNQAIRWGMDPFAVMPETYVVGGKLGYQGKLIAAVVNSRAGLQGRLRYTFTGTKGSDDYTITVSGTFRSETEACEITLSVKEAKTDNKMWSKDPEQKLVYSGSIKWARRYCPEVVLGVVTDDDLDRINEAGAKQADAREVKPLFEKTESSSTTSEPVAKAPRAPRKTAAEKSAASTEAKPVESAPNEPAPVETSTAPETPQKTLLRMLDEASIGEGWFMQKLGRKGEMAASLNDEQANDAIARFPEISKED